MKKNVLILIGLSILTFSVYANSTEQSSSEAEVKEKTMKCGSGKCGSSTKEDKHNKEEKTSSKCGAAHQKMNNGKCA